MKPISDEAKKEWARSVASCLINEVLPLLKAKEATEDMIDSVVDDMRVMIWSRMMGYINGHEFRRILIQRLKEVAPNGGGITSPETVSGGR